MKKFSIALILIFPAWVFGQVRIGVTAGYQFTNIGRYDLVETSSIGNALIGGISEYHIPKSSFYLISQVLYSTAGYGKSNLQAADKDGNLLGKIDLHRAGYISMPLYILYGGKTKSVTIKGGIGFFVAFQVGDKLKIKAGDSFGNGTALPLYKKRISPVLCGPAFRAGIQWSSFDLSLHFSQSINGLYESQPAAGQKWRITGYGFSIGYFFTK
jgi:hypothetical protein